MPKALKIKTAQPDAIDILTADQTRLKKLFAEFRHLVENDDTNITRKDAVVREACDTLVIHAALKERLLYPALRRALRDSILVEEALIQLAAATALIDQLKKMEAGDEFFDAKFIVLGELMTAHFKEEEATLFARARRTKLDLVVMGRRMMRMQEERVLGMRIETAAPRAR